MLRIQDGSASAERLLYDRYVLRLEALARKRWPAVLESRLDPEDVVQSALRTFFGRAREGMYEVEPDGDLWGLLMVITLNKLRVKQAWHLAAKRDARRTTAADTHLERISHGPEGEEELIVDEITQRLPPEHRRIVQLRLEGYDVVDVAQMIGRSKRTVERLLKECRELMTSMISESDTTTL